MQCGLTSVDRPSVFAIEGLSKSLLVSDTSVTVSHADLLHKVKFL